MDQNNLIILAIVFLLLLAGGVVLYLIFSGKKGSNLDSLMQVSRGVGGGGSASSSEQEIDSEADEEALNAIQAKRKELEKKKGKYTEEEKYYHAGLISKADREHFKKIRITLPIVLAIVFGVAGFFMKGPMFLMYGLVIGGIFGYLAPSFLLDIKIARRQEEIMYYLPLVIEQIAIGVSSSLDIGPCLQRIVQMADERDSHNVVTELVYHAERYIKSGVDLQEALTEIGVKSGHNDLKHAFMALGQVAKHGGEISHQLHELANAVQSQRETAIEAKIKKLELKATGPVALVFFGFIMSLMAGLLIKVKTMF